MRFNIGDRARFAEHTPSLHVDLYGQKGTITNTLLNTMYRWLPDEESHHSNSGSWTCSENTLCPVTWPLLEGETVRVITTIKSWDGDDLLGVTGVILQMLPQNSLEYLVAKVKLGPPINDNYLLRAEWLEVIEKKNSGQGIVDISPQGLDLLVDPMNSPCGGWDYLNTPRNGRL